MSRNKLYTCGYFCKRIVEEGFDVVRLPVKYDQDDIRKWTIVVNQRNSTRKINVLITCFKNEETKEFSFKFQGRRKAEFMLESLSMKMIIDILKTASSEEIQSNE